MDTPSPQSAEMAAAAEELRQYHVPVPPPAAARGGAWWASALVVVALAVLLGPAYLHHVGLSANPAFFNDDARQQIWPLLRYHDDRLFQSDQVADYFLACFPIGYRSLYAFTGVAMDARVVSKILPYLLLLVTAWGVGQAARRLRGPAAGWAAVALCLGAEIYMARMAGGLPRSFAFPLLALAAMALARGKPILLAVVTIVAAAFYPAVGVVTGLALAAWLLVPARWLGKAQEWTWSRRVVVLVIAGALTVLAALPTTIAANEYGPVLRPSDAGKYPELSATGRYHEEDRGDSAFSLRAMKNFVEAPLAGLGGDWDPSREGLRLSVRQILLMAIAAAGIVGYVLLLKASPPGRRVLLLPIAGIIAYAASVPLVPLLYLPSRYQLYPLALAAVVIVPAGLAHLATVIFRHANQRRTQSLVILAAVGPYLALFSAWDWGIGRKAAVAAGTTTQPVAAASTGPRLSGLASAGLRRRAAEHEKAYAFLATLKPTRTMIAGWPEDMDDVPYVTGRSALVTREGHQTFHEQYANVMRQRMSALIPALYGTDPAAVLALRQQPFGVTHLVVSRSLYGPDAPAYFAPFDAMLAQWRGALGNQTPSPMAGGWKKVFEDPADDWIVLELPGGTATE